MLQVDPRWGPPEAQVLGMLTNPNTAKQTKDAVNTIQAWQHAVVGVDTPIAEVTCNQPPPSP